MNNVKDIDKLIDCGFYLQYFKGKLNEQFLPIWSWDDREVLVIGADFKLTPSKQLSSNFGSYSRQTRQTRYNFLWNLVRDHIKWCEKHGMTKKQMVKSVLLDFQHEKYLHFYANDEALKLLNGVE